MMLPKQKQPQVKKGICRVLEHVDVKDSQSKVSINRPVSCSNGWTGSSMKWRLMRAN